MKPTRTKKRVTPDPEPAARRASAAPPGESPRIPTLTLVRVAELETVRWPRVRTARERIDSGYYEREDVQHLVVNALLNELQRR